MGRTTKLRDLIGLIKDKVSLSRAALLSKPNTLALHLAVLRATTHAPSTPPDEKHLAALLSLGDGSRATASALVASLIRRLRRTGDAAVALKCLLTIHHVTRRGPFILQDQISAFPSGGGGRNPLKLSAFRDGATAATWVLSSWVRWYARYIETLISTSGVLGFFLSSTSRAVERVNQGDKISSFTNTDLIRDVDVLVGVTEEICRIPDSQIDDGNKILYEIMGLTARDCSSVVNEALLRLGEFRERLNCLSFGESVELMCALKRMEDCKERLMGLFSIKKASTENLWSLIGELKKKIDRDGGNLLLTMGRRDQKGSASARYGGGLLEKERSDDQVKFSSARFDINKFPL